MATELMLMNPSSGVVQSENDWSADGYTVGKALLIPVEWDEESQSWVEV